jgi:group I intron endonuclease
MDNTIQNPYGFVYITTNLINGKRYIGRCKFDTTRPNAWKTYLGSGVALKLAIKKYGRQNFQKVIVSFAINEEELNNQEMALIDFFDAVSSDDYYNVSNGQYSNAWIHKTEEEKNIIRKKISDKSMKNILSREDYDRYIKDLSIQMSGKNNPFYGKKHTDETKTIISQKASERQMGDKIKNHGKVFLEKTILTMERIILMNLNKKCRNLLSRNFKMDLFMEEVGLYV